MCGEQKMLMQGLVQKSGERENLEDLGIDWRIMFTHVLKKDDEMAWNIFCFRIGTNCGYL